MTDICVLFLSQLSQSNLSRDLMLAVNCRDLNKQLGDAQHLHQLKVDAQAAITDAGKQKETQRALKRKLIRAKTWRCCCWMRSRHVTHPCCL